MKTAQEVMKESDNREHALQSAIKELEEFQQRHRRLLELAPVFIAIDAVKAKRPETRKPVTERLQADSCCSVEPGQRAK